LFTLPAMGASFAFPVPRDADTYLTPANLPSPACGQPPILGCTRHP
jgi:hypothetical protein